jgi:hypothetical protein
MSKSYTSQYGDIHEALSGERIGQGDTATATRMNDLVQRNEELLENIKWFNQVVSGNSKRLVKDQEDMRKLLQEMCEYLDNNDLNSIASGSCFHKMMGYILSRLDPLN